MFKKILNTSLILKYLSYFVIIINSNYSNANSTEPSNSSVNVDPKSSWVTALQIPNTAQWQELKRNKEVADLNYDLYRINGLTNTDNVILAQDPKGYFIKNHNKYFCAPNIDKSCPVTLPLYTYGDLRANLLLENSYYEPDHIKLATEIIKNIINPFPSNIALEMLQATDKERNIPANKNALAEMYASQTRLGVARNSLYSMFFNRLPLNNLTDSKLSNSAKMSVISIMEQQAKQRFEDLHWHQLIDKADHETKLKEIAEMESFKIWLDYHKYKQNERIESLLATLVAQQENIYKLLSQSNGKNN